MKTPIRIACSFLFLCLTTASSGQAKLSPKQYKALEANLNMGYYGKVLSTTENENNLDASLLRGQALDATGSPLAADCFSKALEWAPQNGSVWALYGLEMARANHLKEAKVAVDKALKLNPDDPFILASHGFTLVKMGDQKEGFSELAKAHTLDEKSKNVRLLLFDSYVRNLEKAKAFEEINSLIKDYPRLPILLVKQGQLYEDTGASDKARASYSKALLINPQFQLAYVLRAKSNVHDGRLRDGLDDCKSALRVDNAPELVQRAICLKVECDRKLGYYKDVIAGASTYLSNPGRAKDGSDTSFNVQMAKVEAYQKLRNFTAALKDIDGMIAQYPHKTQVIFIKAQICIAMGNKVEALHLLDGLIRRDDMVSQWHRARADVLRQTGQNSQAIQDEKRAAQLDD